MNTLKVITGILFFLQCFTFTVLAESLPNLLGHGLDADVVGTQLKCSPPSLAVLDIFSRNEPGCTP